MTYNVFFSKRNTTSSAILIYNPPTEHALIILFLVLLYSFCWLLHVSPLQAVKWNLSNLIYKRNTLNGFHHPNLDHCLRSRERTGVLIWHDQCSEVILLAAIRSYRCPFSDSLSVGSVGLSVVERHCIFFTLDIFGAVPDQHHCIS